MDFLVLMVDRGYSSPGKLSYLCNSRKQGHVSPRFHQRAFEDKDCRRTHP